MDVDPDVVHMEIQDTSGGALPLPLSQSLAFVNVIEDVRTPGPLDAVWTNWEQRTESSSVLTCPDIK